MLRLLLPVLIVLATGGCREQRQQFGQALSGQPPVIAGSLDGDWLVADLNGGGVVAGVSLRFDTAPPRISGSSGCNRFAGGWRMAVQHAGRHQVGQTIRIGPLAATKMACAPAVMDVEKRTLALLQSANSVIFTGPDTWRGTWQDNGPGKAILVAPGGRRLTLRRPPQP